MNCKWQEMDQPAEAGWWTPLQQFMPPATPLQCQGSHLPKSFLTPAFAHLKALVQRQAGLPSMANHSKFWKQNLTGGLPAPHFSLSNFGLLFLSDINPC